MLKAIVATDARVLIADRSRAQTSSSLQAFSWVEMYYVRFDGADVLLVPSGRIRLRLGLRSLSCRPLLCNLGKPAGGK